MESHKFQTFSHLENKLKMSEKEEDSMGKFRSPKKRIKIISHTNSDERKR